MVPLLPNSRSSLIVSPAFQTLSLVPQEAGAPQSQTLCIDTLLLGRDQPQPALITMVLGAAVEAMVSSPLALVITAAAAVVALAVIRVLANTFHGSKPPIFEGIPFVGGLMKFAGVSAWCQGKPSMCCCTNPNPLPGSCPGTSCECLTRTPPHHTPHRTPCPPYPRVPGS